MKYNLICWMNDYTPEEKGLGNDVPHVLTFETREQAEAALRAEIDAKVGGVAGFDRYAIRSVIQD